MMKLSEQMKDDIVGTAAIYVDEVEQLEAEIEDAKIDKDNAERLRDKTFATNASLLEALKDIAKGEGAYSLDPLKHAGNTISNTTRIATEAIRKAKGE